ncbi:hypothetical protein PHET_01079 [Paragonimus heterotremus]|uniref:Uncharacterized protein n=1 Tax=Paragonimus heterotremus TaxID=100268 RepID=A0A8J4WUU4_9TREM|nr:hypothetical protein PHET_01079 [Paragonimus heterotremus]
MVRCLTLLLSAKKHQKRFEQAEGLINWPPTNVLVSIAYQSAQVLQHFEEHKAAIHLLKMTKKVFENNIQAANRLTVNSSRKSSYPSPVGIKAGTRKAQPVLSNGQDQSQDAGEQKSFHVSDDAIRICPQEELNSAKSAIKAIEAYVGVLMAIQSKISLYLFH